MAEFIDEFSQDVLDKMVGSTPNHKYYVYRLVDPRNMQTFYVGKGCANRAFQHARDAEHLLLEKDQTKSSEKIALIQEINSIPGKHVICLIHRWGLSEQTAFEVEAALIDAYPGLTNQIGGFYGDRGVALAEDLQADFSAMPYEDANIPQDYQYIIIKTSYSAISKNGSLYEATRKAWANSLRTVRKYKYVLSTINGVVREVYKVEPEEWKESKAIPRRIEFDNDERIANDTISRSLIGKKIPQVYRQKGSARPLLLRKK